MVLGRKRSRFASRAMLVLSPSLPKLTHMQEPPKALPHTSHGKEKLCWHLMETWNGLPDTVTFGQPFQACQLTPLHWKPFPPISTLCTKQTLKCVLVFFPHTEEKLNSWVNIPETKLLTHKVATQVRTNTKGRVESSWEVTFLFLMGQSVSVCPDASHSKVFSEESSLGLTK